MKYVILRRRPGVGDEPFAEVAVKRGEAAPCSPSRSTPRSCGTVMPATCATTRPSKR